MEKIPDDTDKLLDLCPSCSKHDSWSSCVCSRLEQAYELGKQSKDKALSDANKEIERLKGLVYEISNGNINPDTGKEYFSGLDPNKFNKQF